MSFSKIRALLKGNTVKDGSGTEYYVLVDSDGRLLTEERQLKFVDQRGLEVSSSTPTQLPDVACVAVQVIGHPSNTGAIFLGGSDVNGTAGNTNCGIPVTKWLGAVIDVEANADELYALAAVNSEDLCLAFYLKVS